MGNEEPTQKLYSCSVATAVILFVCVACFLVVLVTPNYIETSARSSLGKNSVDFGLFYSCAMNDYNSAFECSYINENCATSTSFIMAAYGYTVWQSTSVVTYNYSQFAAMNGQNVKIFNECDLFNVTRSFFTIYTVLSLLSTLFMVSHTCKVTKFRNFSFIFIGGVAFIIGIVAVILSSVFKDKANFFYGSSPETAENWGYSMILFGSAFGLFSLTSVIFGLITHRLLANAEKDDEHGRSSGSLVQPLIHSDPSQF